jgi:hypothetical protein
VGLDEEAAKQDRSRSNLIVLLIRRGLDGAAKLRPATKETE